MATRANRMFFSALVLSGLMAVGYAGAAARSGGSSGKTKAPLGISVKAHPFNLNEVQLLEGPFKKAMEINRAYLLKLDADRFLWPFHERAGMAPKGKRYGGWEKLDVVGHTSGHYLSACSLTYASTGDKELKRRVDYMVAEIAKAQAKHGNGYAGSVRTEVWTKTFSGNFKVHQWGLAGGYVPWYVLHKTYAGLVDAYTHAGNKQALEVVRKFADWAKKGTDNLSDEQFQKMLRCEYGGMNEAMANLYALTGNKDYLSLARRFDHKQIFAPLEAQRDELKGKHVNTLLPKIVGAARMYELTGEKRYATLTRFLWDRAVDTRSFAPGGVDFHERFCAPGEEAKFLNWDSTETCCVYNMLKLTRHLFGWRPDAGYMDYYERALYNHILGSQDPASGGVTYFYSLRPGHFKIYSTPFDSMWCCVGTGIENHSKYGDTIYHHNKDTLWVNLFIPSQLNWKEKGVTVRQETKFPRADTTTITVSAKKQQKFSVRIRVPYWATKGAEVRINGREEKVQAKPQSYLTLSRAWKDGDKIEIRLPMSLHLYRARDDKSLVVVMYGPLVLAGELGRGGMPKNLCVGNNKQYSGDPDPPVPVLVFDSKDPSTWIKPVKGEPLKFRTVNAAKPNDVSLVPLYQLHHQRYTAYWKTAGSKQWNTPLKPATVAANQISGGLLYSYYEGRWAKLPEFDKLSPVKQGVIKNFNISPRKRNDSFGFVFSGYLKISKAGSYSFMTSSDDGSRLWISGRKVVDNDGIHADVARQGIALLKPGYYPIKVSFFEGAGGEALRVSWWSQGKWSSIPDGMLFHAKK